MRSEPKVALVTDLAGDVHTGLALASRLAAERGAAVWVVHVVDMTSNEGEALIYHGIVDHQPSAEERLARLRPADPSIPVVHLVEVGDPETVIAKLVEREHLEVVVMEARQRSVWRRLLRRSLTSRLVDRLPCSLVTYRAREEEPEPRRVRSVVESEEELTTLLNARVDGLVGWMRAQSVKMTRIAESRSVRDAVSSLVRARRHDPFQQRVRRNLELELAEHLRALPAMGIEVEHRGATVLRRGVVSKPCATRDAFRARWGELAAVSLPLEAEGWAGMVIEVAAPIPLTGGEHARVSFTLDARRDFLRILDEPGPSPSAETYAFDADGVMVSNSRFAHQLRRVGLLPFDPRVQTPRRLRLCDPGGNLLEGYTRRSECPLTRMALDATAGHDGADWHGYRDYRGVEVVGAWRWIDELGFGVAAEVDRPALHLLA